ncbi:phage baseplate protein, partial [Leptospira interrogans]
MKILNGRDRIALTDGDEEVELNVSLGIQHSYPVEITRHTVEKEKGMTSITDHVIPGQREISLNVLISSSTDLLALSEKSVDDKLETLVRWQSQGTLVTLLGYST